MKHSNSHHEDNQTPSDRLGGSRPNPDVAGTGAGGAMTTKPNAPDHKMEGEPSEQGVSPRESKSFDDLQDDLKNNP